MSNLPNNSQKQEDDQQYNEGDIDNLLWDPEKKAELIRKLGLTNPWPNPLLTPSGTSVGDRSADLTLSGKSAGSGGIPPLWPFNPFFQLQLVPWPLPGGQLRKPPAGAEQGQTRRTQRELREGPHLRFQ